MNIVVCIKQVPDLDELIAIEKGEIIFQNQVSREVVNPLDLLALEEALRIKERDEKSRVTLVSLGRATSEESLRKGLAMGADVANLLCDPGFENGDSYTTALALARHISTIPYDLVLCGRVSDDTQAGLVGAYIAGILGLPVIQGVIGLDIEGRELIVQRKLERGNREVLKCPLPALLTVEAGLNTPRHLTVPGIFKTRKKEIATCDAKTLGFSSDEVGQNGSKIRIIHVSPPKPKMKGLIIPDSRLSPAERLKLIASGGLESRKSNMLEGEHGKVAAQLVQFFKQNKIL